MASCGRSAQGRRRGGGPHVPTVPLEHFVSVWEKTSTYRITENQRAPSAYTVFSTPWAQAITVFRVYIVTVMLNIITYMLVFRMELFDWTKFVLLVFLHLHLLYCNRLKHISVSVIKYLLKVLYYTNFQIFIFIWDFKGALLDQLSRKLQNSWLPQTV